MSLRKISENTAWLLLEKLVRSLMTIFVGALVVRHLGPEQYGQLAYVIALIALFQSIASLGLEGVVIREILVDDGEINKTSTSDKYLREKAIPKKAANKKNVQLLISSTFAVRLLTGAALLFLVTMVTGVLKNWSLNAIALTILMGGPLIFQAADIFDLWNQSRLNSKLTAILKIFSYIISNGLRIFLVIIDAGILWFAAAFFVEAFVIGFGLYLAYTNTHKMVYAINTQVYIIKKLLRETWPVIASSLFAAVYFRFDQITLGSYLGPKELGIYSAALLFATATYFIPGIICASVMPEAIRAKQKNIGEYIKLLRYLYFFLLLLSLVIFTITYLAADYIFFLFYTESFAEGINILQLYALANVPVYLGVVHGIWMVNDKKLIISVYRAVLGAATAIVLCLYLVPTHGMAGAVYSTIAALIVADIIVPVAMNATFFKLLFNYRDR